MDETQDQQEEAAHEFIPQKPANNAAHSLSQRGHQVRRRSEVLVKVLTFSAR